MYVLNMTTMPRTRGRKPLGYVPLQTVEDVVKFMLDNPLHSQVQKGSSRTLDTMDRRLYDAVIRRNTLTGAASLWTSHNIRVSASGVSSSAGDRNAMRWYQIDGLTAELQAWLNDK